MPKAPFAGRYRIIDRPGGDGVCETLTARDERTDGVVTVRWLLAEADGESRARFERHVTAWGRLDHPNVSPLLDSGTFEGRPYLVHGAPPTATVRSLQRAGRSLETLLDVVTTAALALEHAHEQGVVHRNLSSEAIVVDRAGRTLVVGWNEARPAQGGATVTRTGVVRGNPAYMAPEVVVGGEVTAAADVYALGVVLYEILAGALPIVGDSAIALCQAQVEQVPPPLERRAAGLPRSLTAVVMAMLAKTPADRPTMSEVAGVLTECAATATGEPSGGERVSGSRRTVAAVVLACLAVAFVVAIRSGSTSSAPSAAPVETLDVDGELSGRFEAVELRFAGMRDDSLDVVVRAAGRTLVTTTIDGGAARQVSRRYSVASVPLGGACFEPLDVEVRPAGSSRPVRSMRLVPTAAVVAELEPLAALTERQTAGLLRSLDRGTRSTERVTVALADYGVSAAFVAELRATLSRLGPVTAPGSVVDGRLLPLRHVEALLADAHPVQPPWGFISGLLGFDFVPVAVGPAPSDDLRAPWEAAIASFGHRVHLLRPVSLGTWRVRDFTALVKTVRTSTVKGDGPKEQWSWLVPGPTLERYRRSPDDFRMTYNFMNRLTTAANEVFPTIDGLTSSIDVAFPVAPPVEGETWPPTEARLDLFVRALFPDAVVVVTVNDGPAITVTNVGTLFRHVLLPAETFLAFVGLPLRGEALRALQVGDNRVTIGVTGSPLRLPAYPLAIGAVALRVPPRR